MSVVCCIGRGLCDELINRSEESYRMWCVVVCDIMVETSRNERVLAYWELSRQNQNRTDCLLCMYLPVVHFPRSYITSGCSTALPVENLICVHCLHLGFKGFVKILFFSLLLKRMSHVYCIVSFYK